MEIVKSRYPKAVVERYGLNGNFLYAVWNTDPANSSWEESAGRILLGMGTGISNAWKDAAYGIENKFIP